MTTVSAIDCQVSTPPPVVTFDGGPATNGSCAAVQAQYPGDTVTAVPIVSTTQAPPVTTTTQAPTTTSPTNSPSGYAGISGGGENCGAGPTGMCPTAPITGVPTTIAPVQVATPLAFTGADLEATGGLGLAAVLVGVLLVIRAHRKVRHA